MEGESPTQASAPAGAVFLSYASQECLAAERICEALRTAGIEVWFDKSEFTCNFSFADVSSINKPDSHFGGPMSGQLLNRRELLTLAAGAYAVPALVASVSASASNAVSAALGQYIERYLQTMGSPGLTLGLASADGPIHTQAFGFVDLAAKIPVTAAHLFQIGSITKSFAAVILLQLQEEGRLAFDHDITRYLPWLPIETDYGPIQIHHLLTHTAGLAEDVTVIPVQPGGRYRQSFAPGTRFHYSNFGYSALGRLIEKVDGRSWELALRKRIFEPLGMTDTAPTITNSVRARIAQSYVPQQDDRFYHRGTPLAVAGNINVEVASGSIASTSTDMARYMSMFINRGAGPTRRILQEASFKALATAHAPPGAFGPNAGYGYGLAVEQLDGHTMLWHPGGMVSFMSAIHIDLDAGFGAFACINAQQDYRPNAVARYALKLLRAHKERKPKPEAPSADETDLTDTKDYEGSYVSERGERIEVSGEHGALLLRVGSKHITLRHREEEQFVADEPEFELFPWVFGRAPAQSSADAKTEKEGPVIELSWGPRWYGRSDHVAASPVDQGQMLKGLVGLYYNENPWFGCKRVIERRGRLWLNGAIPLDPLGGHLFRWVDEPQSPETAEFLEFVDGQAQLLRVSGGELRRISDSGWQWIENHSA